MTATADIALSESGAWRVFGDLTFSTVIALRKKGETLIKSANEDINIDFSGVHASGSAGVSLMMCWLRVATQSGKRLHFSEVPARLARIIDVSGLTEYLLADTNSPIGTDKA